jgi:hypothetical protein
MWLFVLWLAVGHRVPEPSSAQGVLADVYRLANATGLITVGITVSVAAYILGVIAARIGLTVTYAIGAALRRTPVAPITPGHHREVQVKKAVVYLVLSRLSQRFSRDAAFRSQLLDRVVSDPPADPPAETKAEWEQLTLTDQWIRYWIVGRVVDAEKLADELQTDSYDIIVRLRGASDPVALEHDRLQAEGDFRIAVFGPLAAACVVLAIRWTPWCLLALPVLTCLIYVGVEARTEAEQGLAAALAAGRVNDPSLARLDAISIPLRDGESTTALGVPTATEPDPERPQ